MLHFTGATFTYGPSPNQESSSSLACHSLHFANSLCSKSEKFIEQYFVEHVLASDSIFETVSYYSRKCASYSVLRLDVFHTRHTHLRGWLLGHIKLNLQNATYVHNVHCFQPPSLQRGKFIELIYECVVIINWFLHSTNSSNVLYPLEFLLCS